jgi:hypothetical protein
MQKSSRLPTSEHGLPQRLAKATPNLLPSILTDGPDAGLAAAAGRFLALPEIAKTIFSGSNGYSVQLPTGNEAQLALWSRWPDHERCLALARGLNEVMAVPCDQGQAVRAVRGLIAGFPTGERVPSEFRETLACVLAEQASEQGWSAAAVSRGLLAVIKTSRFLPAVSEVLDAIAEAHRELKFAAWASWRAIDVWVDLKWNLIEAGIIEDEDNGENF